MSKIAGPLHKYQFSTVRILLGLYLTYFFTCLLEQRELIEKLLDARGQSASLLLTQGLPALALILSLLLFVGLWIPQVSLALFICFQTEFLLLPIPREVQASYISLLLLVFFFFAVKEKGSFFLITRLSDPLKWQGALFLAVYFGFTVSGLSKLFYKPWLNGEAINYFFTTSQIGNMNGLWIGAFIPKTLLGYLVLFVEISSFPLALFTKTRRLTWTLNTLLHLCIPLFLYVWPVSLGVLMMQLMLFESRWLQASAFFKTKHAFWPPKPKLFTKT